MVEAREAAARERELVGAIVTVLTGQTLAWQGSVVSVNELRLLSRSPGRRLRERAWRAEMERRALDVPAIDELWAELVRVRRRIAHAARAETSAAYLREQDPDGLAPQARRELRQAIEEFVTPVLVRVYERRRRRLNARSMRPWDLEQDPRVRQGKGESDAPRPMARDAVAADARRAGSLESALLGWTYAAMIDTWETRVSEYDRCDVEALAAEWARSWLLYLPAVDWSGLEGLLPAERQRHSALVVRPYESLQRTAREIAAWQARLEGDEETRRGLPAVDSVTVHDVARAIEDELEELESKA